MVNGLRPVKSLAFVMPGDRDLEDLTMVMRRSEKSGRTGEISGHVFDTG